MYFPMLNPHMGSCTGLFGPVWSGCGSNFSGTLFLTAKAQGSAHLWDALLFTQDESQLHTPRVLAPHLLPKINWRRRPKGRDLWLSRPMGFEKKAWREE
jgi:hypothetical protein